MIRKLWNKLFKKSKKSEEVSPSPSVPKNPVKCVYPSRGFSPAPVSPVRKRMEEKREELRATKLEEVKETLKTSYKEWCENNRQLERYFSA